MPHDAPAKNSWPLFRSLASYSLPGDLMAGLTLAAIAIPAFLSQSDKALDAQAKSAARAAEAAAEVIATQNDGSYDGPGGVTVDNLRAVESTLDAASLTVSCITDDEYTVTVASRTGNTFSVGRHANGTTQLSCTLSGTDGCPSDGRWGD